MCSLEDFRKHYTGRLYSVPLSEILSDFIINEVIFTEMEDIFASCNLNFDPNQLNSGSNK